MHELDPELSAWGTTTKTNAILADIFDVLAMMNANLVALGSHKPAKKPKPYPRPHRKDDTESRHFGSKPLPVPELHKWIEQKRANYARSSKSDNNSHAGA